MLFYNLIRAKCNLARYTGFVPHKENGTVFKSRIFIDTFEATVSEEDIFFYQMIQPSEQDTTQILKTSVQKESSYMEYLWLLPD